MSGGKNKYDKAFDKGYEDGKNGNLLHDFVQNVKSVIPGESKEEDSYDVGYNKGFEDRNKSSSWFD